MKRHIVMLLFILLLTSFTSCTKIFMHSYGVRNPKIENKTSILDYLKSNQLDTLNNFALSDTASLNKFFRNNIGMPEILFYDKNGYLMLYRDNKKCNAQNDSLIGFLDPQNLIKIDSSRNLYNYLPELKTLDGKALSQDDFKNYNYYLIIYWAKWTGKVNKIKISDWEESLVKKNDPKIKAIKVTTDYMNFWALNKKDMLKVYRTKINKKKR